ncbi:MAG: fasciclin domain-containing protein [Ilumatobacteraceae bacterium]
MSDSDPSLPASGATPGQGTPPPPPPPTPPTTPPGGPSPAPLPPTEAIPASELPGAAPGALPGDVEPTTQMPVTPGAVPPIYPPDETALDGEDDEPIPWYKKPAIIAAIVVVVLALIGLLLWMLLGGDDDDNATAESSRLIIELTDETGQELDAGIAATVVGPANAETSFFWIRPENQPLGPTAGDSTGTDGRVDFEWEPDETVADPAAWAATVTLVQQLPAGWTEPSPIVDCVLERPDVQDSVVAMNIVTDSPDINVDRFATSTFPNYVFLPGDTVTCKLVGNAPTPDTTVVDTTVVDTTVVDTTVVDTTVPETTTTTTIADTTTTTTTTVITVPPQPAATLWDVIDSNADLSGIKDWIEQAGLQSVFEDPNATLTLIAPSNQAIADAPSLNATVDFDDTDNLVLIVNTHLVDTDELTTADIAALSELVVVEPGPHAVDSGVSPPTIGGANMLLTDVVASNGVIHVIDEVLLPVAPLAP